MFGVISLFAEAPGALSVEEGRIGIAVAVPCTVFICGLVWWLAQRFQKLSDTQETISKRLDSIEQDLRDQRDNCIACQTLSKPPS